MKIYWLSIRFLSYATHWNLKKIKEHERHCTWFQVIYVRVLTSGEYIGKPKEWAGLCGHWYMLSCWRTTEWHCIQDLEALSFKRDQMIRYSQSNKNRMASIRPLLERYGWSGAPYKLSAIPTELCKVWSIYDRVENYGMGVRCNAEEGYGWRSWKNWALQTA